MKAINSEVADVLDAERWGLPVEAVDCLAERLYSTWDRFRPCFKTRTRDGGAHAWAYLRGLLTMDGERTFANIARRVVDPADDGQGLQQFMSDSPWSARVVIEQVQDELKATPALSTGGVLILDESADEKAGGKSAGAGRQHNGRLGIIDMCQVGTFLAFATESVWTWVDGELFLPKEWFNLDNSPMQRKRQQLGIPAEREFATKVELGWQMIERVADNDLPFEAVLCDDLYGRSAWLRRKLDEARLIYMADVPATLHVYLAEPKIGLPPPELVRHGPAPKNARVVNGVVPIKVRDVARLSDTHFQRIQVRSTERGVLDDAFAMRRVWTVREGGVGVAQEWLVIRQEKGQGDKGPVHFYALSNAPENTEPQRLAWLKCMRYFIERANQDAKSEVGWGELQAQKYLAWEHHLALTVLATWFIAQTKLDWSTQHTRDPALQRQLELEVLPALSVANVRFMLKAVMPLAQLSPQQAVDVVVNHLVNRSRSKHARLKAQHRSRGPT